jgi:exodeoxyribonuclease VII large subunit
VDVAIVARGGGSLADLFAFCDETLCRTVALLRVPVIASVGHHTDRTLIDDVAAVCCSTPTHAAETAVRIDVTEARTRLIREGRRLDAQGRRAVLDRARTLAGLARAPAEHVARSRRRLHQQLRELRASGRRRVAREREETGSLLLALRRTTAAARGEQARADAGLRRAGERLRHAGDTATTRRHRDLERLALALTAHDPARTLERGYALVEDSAGEIVASAEQARAAATLALRFHDGRVRATVEDCDR